MQGDLLFYCDKYSESMNKRLPATSFEDITTIRSSTEAFIFWNIQAGQSVIGRIHDLTAIVN